MVDGEAEGEEVNDDWINSLDRDIEITEGQIALTSVLPSPATAFIHVEVERLKRLVKAAKITVFKEKYEADFQKSGKAKYPQEVLDDLLEDDIIGQIQYETLRRMVRE